MEESAGSGSDCASPLHLPNVQKKIIINNGKKNKPCRLDCHSFSLRYNSAVNNTSILKEHRWQDRLCRHSKFRDTVSQRITQPSHRRARCDEEAT